MEAWINTLNTYSFNFRLASDGWSVIFFSLTFFFFSSMHLTYVCRNTADTLAIGRWITFGMLAT